MKYKNQVYSFGIFLLLLVRISINLLFFLDLLADLHAAKLLSEKSVTCSLSIINKADPWLLRYQGAKPVK